MAELVRAYKCELSKLPRYHYNDLKVKIHELLKIAQKLDKFIYSPSFPVFSEISAHTLSLALWSL